MLETYRVVLRIEIVIYYTNTDVNDIAKYTTIRYQTMIYTVSTHIFTTFHQIYFTKYPAFPFSVIYLTKGC